MPDSRCNLVAQDYVRFTNHLNYLEENSMQVAQAYVLLVHTWQPGQMIVMFVWSLLYIVTGDSSIEIIV